MNTRSLSTSQLELLWPRLTDKDDKENVWKLLHDCYLNGTNATPPDEEKAVFYLALRLHISLADDDAAIALKWFSWFTTWRLFLLRDGREHNVFQRIYSVSCYGYTNILQFSYGLELIPCIAQLCNKPSIIFEDEWQSTVTNALVWVIINGCSVATGYAWINLIGFAFDIWHDWYYTNNEIKALQALLTNLIQNGEDSSSKTANSITAKIKELQYKQVRVTLVAIGIFIGMAIFYLNPIAPGWVPIFGATLVILFGAVIGNLGNRLCQWDKFLINLFSDSSFKKVGYDALTAILDSIKKLFKELIKPLSPTLYNSLGNIMEEPGTALACIIFAALPSLALAYACIYFSALLCLVSAHVLLTIGVILVATELCTRLCTYIFSQPENAENIKRIMRQLEEPLTSQHQQRDAFPFTYLTQTETYFKAFSKLNQKDFETLAKLAELSVKELLHHINCWDNDNAVEHTPTSPSSSKTPMLKISTCRYSFLAFQQKITEEREKPEISHQPSRELTYS